MATNVLISVICHDRNSLVADVAGRLFDLNIQLGDTTFAVLGDAAEFTCIAEVPGDVTLEAIEREIASLNDMDEARITVSAFDMKPVHEDSGHITHRIELDGRDRPGIIARVSEVFGQFSPNIVRLNSEHIPEKGHDRYVTRFAVNIPERRTDACLATIANTAGEMRMTFRYERVED